MLHVLLPSSVPKPLKAQGRFICKAHLFVVFHGCGANLPGDMGVMEYLLRKQGVWDSPPRKLKTSTAKKSVLRIGYLQHCLSGGDVK